MPLLLIDKRFKLSENINNKIGFNPVLFKIKVQIKLLMTIIHASYS